MRIISKTHDYYDYGLAYGQDPNIIYTRNPRIATHFKIHWREDQILPFFFRYPRPIYSYYGDDNFAYINTDKISHRFVHAICGKVVSTTFAINGELLEIKTIDSLKYEKIIKDNSVILGTFWHQECIDPMFVSKLWNGKIPNYPIRVNNTCYLIAEHSFFSDFKLQDAINGSDLFNQISTYIPNMNPKELVVLSDKEKLLKAGFDKKVSFRHPI